ncbi:MAG: hypothetical protein GY952_11135 [Rhodobacteraceae bacterium]|nr:hypothetical protein [Paracoccaceae bacterium]
MSLYNRRGLLAGSAALLLWGCGFEPVYKKGSAASELRGKIAIDVVRGRNGFELRERLEERLGRAGEAAPYVLTFKLDVTQTGLAVTADEGTTRYNLTGVVKYTIRNSATGIIVFEDQAKNFTAFSSTTETYPTRVAELDANVRLAQALAEQIAARIAVTAKGWHK